MLFRSVMFENHADPIVAGRDGIGYSKIYADMPKFGHYEGKCTARAYSWDFKFMDLQLDLNGEAEDPKRMMDLAAQSQGKMNYCSGCRVPCIKPEEMGKTC